VKPVLHYLGDTCEKLAEADLAVLIDVEDAYDSLYQRVLLQLRHVEDLPRVQVTTTVRIDLFEACVQLLNFLLCEMAGELRRIDVAHK